MELQEKFLWREGGQNTATGFLARQLMPRACQCRRSIWITASSLRFNFWLALMWSGFMISEGPFQLSYSALQCSTGKATTGSPHSLRFAPSRQARTILVLLSKPLGTACDHTLLLQHPQG